jgi:hypothetical protein
VSAEFPVTLTFGDVMADVQWRRDSVRRQAEAAIEYMTQVRQAMREALGSYCKGIPAAEEAAQQIIGEIDDRITFERAVYVEPDAPANADAGAGRWRLSVGRSRPRGRRFRRTSTSSRGSPSSDDGSGDPEPGPEEAPGDLDLTAWLADRERVLAALIAGWRA